MTKKELRRHIRGLKQQYGNEELAALSLPIMRRFLSNPAIMRAETILMYYSLPDEVNTHDVISHLAANGKRILLPAVISDKEMELRRYRGPQDMIDGLFSIKEPAGEIFSDYENIDVAVIPGMSFDAHNNRLGRGKGYYDRFLTKVPYIYKVGICFDFQKLPEIPADENDIRMDEVI